MCHEIHTDANLPALSLPPGALSTHDHRHEYDVESDPADIEPIEHQIRLDFMAGGPIRHADLLDDYNPWSFDPDDPTTNPWADRRSPIGLDNARASCRQRIDLESRFFDSYESDEGLDDAPQFLAHRLREARDATDPAAAVEEERERRVAWYRKLIPGANFCHVLKQTSAGTLVPDGETLDRETLLRQNDLVGMVVVDDDTDPGTIASEYGIQREYCVAESDLSNATADVATGITEFGIELPAPLLIGKYATGSRYPLIPWGDGIVCSCPYKQNQPWRVICKHELLASIVAGEEDTLFLPKTSGLEIPHRARRFVSPDFAPSHRPSA
jgi:hypothetical protein